MPIYEYKCDKCENVDEVFQKFTDPAPEGCSKCHSSVHKIISQTSFALKGSGWYVTDYKAGGGAKPAAEGTVTEGGKADAPEIAPQVDAAKGTDPKTEPKSTSTPSPSTTSATPAPTTPAPSKP